MPSVRASAGFKQFFSPPPLDTPALSIHGIGVHERMMPSLIRRPRGTGDVLFMLFHDEACAACSPEMGASHPPETFMIWMPGVGQFYGNAARPYSHSWIHCAGSRIGEWLRTTRLPVGRPFPVREPRVFSECLLALHGELVSHAAPDAVIASNLLENGLRELARRLRSDASVAPVPAGLLAARRQIGVASAERVTLSMLATTAGMSVSHFCARFKEAFGRTPVQCLIEHRLDHAAYLLDDTTLGVAEIAQRVGYADAFHFSKAFRKRFGKSPRSLRQARHG